MDYFKYKYNQLYCEGTRVEDIVKKTGTPVYVYSKKTILLHLDRLKSAFGEVKPMLCYSVKANSNLSILKTIMDAGAGFDVVSGGEIFRVLAAGAEKNKVVFSGIGKSDEEIEYAIDKKLYIVIAESEEELKTINSIAKGKRKNVNVALRINPDVTAGTHEYITTGKKENKFGINEKDAKNILKKSNILKNINVVGVHTHIGSQITNVQPYVRSIKRVTKFINWCRENGIEIKVLDIGGGFGIFYKDKKAPHSEDFAEKLIPLLKKLNCKIILEPGRFIIGNAGILVTKVLYNKRSGGKNFVICDSGMNHLIRPTLYSAYHRIEPVQKRRNRKRFTADIVGPICESGDFFAKDRRIQKVERNELIAVFSAGAYGYTMASNYNSQPKPPEVLVSDKKFKIISKRQNYEDLVRDEV